MNITEINHLIHTLNEDELFYREYQEKKRNPRIFNQYLKSLDRTALRNKKLIVPEFPETMPPSKLSVQYYPGEGTISVRKHNCFTPVFKHSHDFFEAFYVMEGMCTHDISGKNQTLYTGDFCIVPPGVEHTVSVQDTSIIITMIYTREAIANAFRNPTLHRNNVLTDFFLKSIYIKDVNDYLIFHTGNDEHIKNIVLEMMMECSNQFPEYEQILVSLNGIFFANMMRYYSNSVEYPKFLGRTSSIAYGIVTFIQENHRTVKLSDVAHKFHYTPEHTSRFIKEVTNMSFSELLYKYRMEHAETLLKDTSLPIADVAYEIGYENAETFNKIFKKHYRCTPTEYRRKKREAERW